MDKSTKSHVEILPYKSNFHTPKHQYSGNCNSLVQRQYSKAFKRGGASNQDLFLLLQIFLKGNWGYIYHPFRQLCVKQSLMCTVFGTGQLLHAGKLGFVWRTVKSKCISKLKQWRTVFVASFCPYFKNMKL